jgi:hypothetical protein
MMAWARTGWVGGFLIGALMNAVLFVLLSGSKFSGSLAGLSSSSSATTRILSNLDEYEEEEVGILRPRPRHSIVICGTHLYI